MLISGLMLNMEGFSSRIRIGSHDRNGPRRSDEHFIDSADNGEHGDSRE